MAKKQAIGLALVIASGQPTLSHALSLGDIQFSSRVNEPFKARIELLHTTQQELDKLQVHVAPPSIFAQAQLQRPAFIDSLKFARSVKNGKHYLIVSSSQAVSEADFNLLLEVTSPKGDLLKRYSVALKGEAEASSKVQTAQTPMVEPATLAPIEEPAAELAALNLALDTEQFNATEVVEPAPVMAPEAAVATPVSRALERSAPVRSAAVKVAIPLPNLAFKHKYRVRKNDTIFSIAERLKIAQLNLDEKALALYARNPKAFVDGDITQLKRGAVLRTPSAVGKRRYADPLPVPTQVVRKATPVERSMQAQTVKRSVVQAPVAPASLLLASAPATVDPPLARAVHELQHASQFKLSDLQERLAQAQQSLEARAQENNQLKELVQEKNRLLTRREEELSQLQIQVAQQQTQAQALMNLGAAGPEGENDLELAEANTWQGVLNSPLVWQAGAASALFLLLLGFWQRRRNADELMQLQVQNSILMPDSYVDEEDEDDKQAGSLLNFLWGEEELEQAREQLQSLRHSIASLREQSQRLQAYLNPTALSSARPITSLQASYQLSQSHAGY